MSEWTKEEVERIKPIFQHGWYSDTTLYWINIYWYTGKHPTNYWKIQGSATDHLWHFGPIHVRYQSWEPGKDRPSA